MDILSRIENEQLKKNITPFCVGDTVRVFTKIKELDAEGKSRERIQIFTGVVVARKGRSIHETFTLRRISYGEGVERIFPLHSPFIEKIDVERRGHTRRAKLYYLRKRVGKEATKVKAKALLTPSGGAVEAPQAAPDTTNPEKQADKPAAATA